MSLFPNLQKDFQHFGTTRRQRMTELVFNIGSWAVISYRLRRWLHQARFPRVIRPFGSALSMTLKIAGEVLTNIEIPASAVIGPGLYVPHTGYIVVNSGVVIGSDCTLGSGVVIGHRGGGKQQLSGCPQIGDRVYIGPGAIIIGSITVGDDALIAPGAVVTRSVPAAGVVAGNPAKLLSLKGSFDLYRSRTSRDAHFAKSMNELIAN